MNILKQNHMTNELKKKKITRQVLGNGNAIKFNLIKRIYTRELVTE